MTAEETPVDVGGKAAVRACVCYLPDTGYLFPSFVSALQARRHTRRDVADILIMAFGIDAEAEAVFSAACERAGILFISRRSADIHGAPAMLARLFLADLLPAQYDRFLYVDGDTQIHGSLDELLSKPVPAGMFRAAADPMVFALGDTDEHGRAIAAHFESLGLSPSQARRYFNTGVIYAEREGWGRTGVEAWAAFSSQPAASRFPDQDVLNLVGLPRSLPLSLAWNFPVYMYNARVAAEIRPRIVHYMSQPKPWEGVFPPWTTAAWAVYRNAASLFPETARYWHRARLSRQARYFLQQRYKRVLETFTWALSAKRDRILAYERDLREAEASDRVA